MLCYCTDCYSSVAQCGVSKIHLVRNIPYADFLLYLIIFFFQCIARLSYLPAGGSTVLLKWDNNGTCRIGSDFKASGSIYCCLEKLSIFFSVQCLNQIPNALSGVYLNKNWFKISEYVFF